MSNGEEEVRELEKYYNARDNARKDLDKYSGILLVGGSGPIVDMVNNQRLHDLILGFYRRGKPLAAECYGVASLAFAGDMEDRKGNPFITGRSTADSYTTGRKLIEVLENGLQAYGW